MIKTHRVNHEEEKENLLGELDSIRKRDCKLCLKNDSLKEQVHHIETKDITESYHQNDKEMKAQNQELKEEVDKLRKQIQDDETSSNEKVSSEEQN